MSKKIGLIAEDESDSQVIRAIIAKMVPLRKFKLVPVHGRGCGKIRGKCKHWAGNLLARGCKYLIIVQDLDCKSLNDLKEELKNALSPCPIADYVVVIPVQTIEAWLLSDVDAIQKALNLQARPNDVPGPEGLLDPKAKLRDVIYFSSQKTKRYVNTVHNGKIATQANLDRLQTCQSFLPLQTFVQGIFR